MFRRFFPLVLVVVVAGTVTVHFAVAEDKAAETAEETAEENNDAAGENNNESGAAEGGIAPFEGDANDATALRKYAGEIFGDIAALVQGEKIDQAEAKLNALEEFAGGLEPTDDAAKTTKDRIASAVTFFRGRIELARISMDDLKKKLQEKPNEETIQQYVSKLGQHLASLADSDPAKAEEELAAAKTFLDEVAESSDSNDDVKRTIRLAGRMFDQLEEMIADQKKLAELIGKDAPPLNVKDWVNGEPLSEEDLKGKVVLLDFWAVWCGPCIATFPHLRQWNEKYAEEGLVIIGLTRYYNMTWDEEAGRAKRSTDEVSAEDEQAMLKKFAEEHNLEHRFAIQEDRTLSDFYAVSGIPHVVLIDRAGKVRLVKVGAGESNAEEIGATIKELISQ